MAKIHLVTGPVGAGKTTLSRRLAAEHKAIRFSIDEWMTTLFTPDLAGDIEYDWAMARIERMESLIWSHVRQLMAHNIGAVLDLGLLRREHREKFYDLARKDGFDIRLHLVESDMPTRWARVEDRNREQGATYSMAVSREMFDFCEGLFERPRPGNWRLLKSTAPDQRPRFPGLFCGETR